jgi:hypothetical protein
LRLLVEQQSLVLACWASVKMRSIIIAQQSDQEESLLPSPSVSMSMFNVSHIGESLCS